ncbi:MAG: nitroreductase family protein [Spirochaetota bacterium]
MTVREAIESRKSVRAFKAQDIPQEILDRVMDAARLAPSARNEQEWRFIVVRDAALRARLAEAAGAEFVGSAPVVIVACAETDKRLMRCGQPAYVIDVAIALDHITLAAVEEGLGTCWIGGFSADTVRTALGIPHEIEIVELLPIGFPARDDDLAATRKKRLALTDIVRFDRW